MALSFGNKVLQYLFGKGLNGCFATAVSPVMKDVYG